MDRYVCVHGHFYQPPRENPWLEEIELQDSAYPYHDWNERITAECYAPNTASRILDHENKIIEIVSNYSKISFNFGPTLLSWMNRHVPEIYTAIIEADKQSQKNFSGHGSAIAQVYNHIIMPLAKTKDKRSQVIWGIKDFIFRFGRYPEGMWLAETAVDLETLEILAENGIKFTILNPYQAQKIRKIGERVWEDASGGKIDPRMPYLCNLASGGKINIFFYDRPIVHDVAFGRLLDNGENFAHRLLAAFSKHTEQSQLVHIATDGETYGHHRRYTEMALSYCLFYIEKNKFAKLTIYGEYLEKFPPQQEVQIFENSSWSCFHGVERWRNDCGCNTGLNSQFNQLWRAPLKEAMDWLHVAINRLYEEQMPKEVKDPWQLRDDYIEIVLERTKENIQHFFAHHSLGELDNEQKLKIIRLLEMQRHTLLMDTSCGWFFDEISGIETVQIMQYAARAMQLAGQISGVDLEPEYLKILEEAPSNIAEYLNGKRVYELFVRPSVIDLHRVCAHYAVSSLFEEYPKTARVPGYTVQSQASEKIEAGKQKLVMGKSQVNSDITYEEQIFSFAALHFGDHNVFAGVHVYKDEASLNLVCRELKEAFQRSDISEIVHLIDNHFGSHNYSLWHLFKDEQRKILNQILASPLKEIETAFRQISEHHYPIMQAVREIDMPLPEVFVRTLEFVFNTDIRNTLEEEEIDLERLQKLVDEAQRWSFDLDKTTLGFVVSKKINSLMEKLQNNQENIKVSKTIKEVFRILRPLSLPFDLWKAQNIHFSLGKKFYRQMQKQTQEDNILAKEWIEYFDAVGNYLNVKSR